MQQLGTNKINTGLNKKKHFFIYLTRYLGISAVNISILSAFSDTSGIDGSSLVFFLQE